MISVSAKLPLKPVLCWGSLVTKPFKIGFGVPFGVPGQYLLNDTFLVYSFILYSGNSQEVKTKSPGQSYQIYRPLRPENSETRSCTPTLPATSSSNMTCLEIDT